MLSNKDLQELVNAKVISDETAVQIQNFYQKKASGNSNRLFTLFGILGALLVGLGIILIVAHNWDQLSQQVKTIIAFVPLAIGHLVGFYVLQTKNDSIAWREGTAGFIFFAIATAIALISQIYHIPGDLNAFLIIWMLLSLPLVYLFRSASTSLFYIAGITYYAVNMGYWDYPPQEPYWYWLLFISILPFYYWLYKNKPQSNFISFHHWLIPLSLVISFGTLATEYGILLNMSYMTLFGIFLLVGNSNYFQNQKILNNGYYIIGHLGTIILLLILSFHWFWDELSNEKFEFAGYSLELYLNIILLIIGIVLLKMEHKKGNLSIWKPFTYVFLLFALLFIIEIFIPIGIVLINLLLLGVGIITILEGNRRNHLGILNFGLLIITAQLISRFFDTNMSFVVRGILFIAVGVGFFVANYRMLQNRKLTTIENNDEKF